MQFKVQELTVNLIDGRVSLSLQGEGLTFINVSLPLPVPANSHGGQLEQRVYEEARRLLEAALDALNDERGDRGVQLEARLAESIADAEDEAADADDEGQFWNERDAEERDREA